MKKGKITKSKISKIQKEKIDIISWITCPHCKKIIMSGEPELVGALLKWRKQSDKKIKEIWKKKK